MTEGWHVGDLETALSGTAKGKVRADYPTLTDTEFKALDPVPVDLSAATSVTAHVRRPDGTVISRAVTLGNQTTNPGTWSLPWVAAIPPAPDDLSVAGGYAVELEAVWAGNRPQTFSGATFQVAREIA